MKNDKEGNPNTQLHRKLNYVRRAGATDYDGLYASGVSIDNVFDEMMLVKDSYFQGEGKGFFHYVFAPDDGDLYTMNKLYDTGIQITELIAHYFGHYQVLMALHYIDEMRPHIHIIANNIDLDTGERFDLNRSRLYLLKEKINVLLFGTGISPIQIKFSGYKHDGM